ncbi:MAG: phospholipid carrier-dependent glycosyltransferase, partial [Frankiales bacterium]|nr:phospholipid carrier-dependent glycosyltransferase [Frankiales bacterium]
MTSGAVHQRTATAGHAPSLPAATDRPPRAVAVMYLPAVALDRVLLVLALVVGAVLRLTDLGAVGLNSDEAVYSSQAASVAGNDNFTGIFPVVRAHPLLTQLLVSRFYADGHPGSGGRYLAA